MSSPKRIDHSQIESAFTSKRWQWFITDPRYLYAPLIDFLIEKLPHIEPSSWPERFRLGGVYINGLMAPESRLLGVPVKVEYYEPVVPIEKIASSFASFSSCRILYEDQYLAIIWKPNRLSCMPSKEQQQYNLKCYLESYFNSVIHMPSRLDMSTQGMLVVSKHVQCHNPLQQLFERRKISKFYLLATDKPVPWRYRWVTNFIERDPRHAVLRQVSLEGGARAETLFRRLANPLCTTNGEPTLLLARPSTGRTHQIRVHAASLGCAIIGDRFYQGVPAPSLHLVSFRIAFKHPITGKYLDQRTPEDLVPPWIPATISNSLF